MTYLRSSYNPVGRECAILFSQLNIANIFAIYFRKSLSGDKRSVSTTGIYGSGWGFGFNSRSAGDVGPDIAPLSNHRIMDLIDRASVQSDAHIEVRRHAMISP